MSKKGTVTITVTSFVPWNSQSPNSDGTNCCGSTATLASNNDKQLAMTGQGTSDYEIQVYKHGSNASFDFQFVAAESLEG